mmetsp:Transcript_25904/g.64337  ORF Transcript_25904/g.64337 Transcript_25904/m.64337 type:complete len:152 (-) Transcript_25904:2316-2771(-)
MNTCSSLQHNDQSIGRRTDGRTDGHKSTYIAPLPFSLSLSVCLSVGIQAIYITGTQRNAKAIHPSIRHMDDNRSINLSFISPAPRGLVRGLVCLCPSIHPSSHLSVCLSVCPLSRHNTRHHDTTGRSDYWYHPPVYTLMRTHQPSTRERER